MCVCVFICLGLSIFLCVSMYFSVCVFVCVCSCVCVRLCMRVRVCLYVCVIMRNCTSLTQFSSLSLLCFYLVFSQASKPTVPMLFSALPESVGEEHRGVVVATLFQSIYSFVSQPTNQSINRPLSLDHDCFSLLFCLIVIHRAPKR